MYKEDLILKQFLDTAIDKGKLGQAYIFEGAPDEEKLELALYLAKKLLCTSEDLSEHPCGECHACKLVESGNHPDCIILDHEKEGLISIQEVREGIVETALIRPYYGGRKIYIIPDAHMMNSNGQNALLKTIEEPPEYAVIILIAKSKELLLPTIRSRCVVLSFKAEPEYEPGDEAEAEQFTRIRSLIMGQESEDTSAALAFARELASQYKDRLPEILSYIERICREALFNKAGVYLTEDAATRYIEKTADIQFESLEQILRSVKTARHDLLINVSAEYVMDSLFMHIITAAKKGNI